MSIIEKLGGRTRLTRNPESFSETVLVDKTALEKLENDFDSMLEALIKIAEFWDDHRFDVDIVDDEGYLEEYNKYSNELDFIYDIIEKPTGKTWEEIKSIIDE